jgi:hypothetical protein
MPTMPLAGSIRTVAARSSRTPATLASRSSATRTSSLSEAAAVRWPQPSISHRTKRVRNSAWWVIDNRTGVAEDRTFLPRSIAMNKAATNDSSSADVLVTGDRSSLHEEFKRSFAINDIPPLEEADALAAQMATDIPIAKTYDHALLVGDRFLTMAGPLEALGYSVGSDETLYLGEVEGLRYVGIVAKLAPDAPARARSWFDRVLISQPAHQPAYDQIQKSYKGGPALHHVALAVSNPPRTNESDEDYALRAIPEFFSVRTRVGELTGAPLQKLTMSIPDAVLSSDRFKAAFASWTQGIDPASFGLEAMLGGGFFLQFASSDSYRVEVVLRQGTKLGFNPTAHTKVSREVSYRA